MSGDGTLSKNLERNTVYWRRLLDRGALDSLPPDMVMKLDEYDDVDDGQLPAETV